MTTILVPGLGMPDLGIPGFVNAPPITDFDSYVYLLDDLVKQYRDAHLVGFSLGADQVLKLTEMWTIQPNRSSLLERATIIDPNIGPETMYLTNIFARTDLTGLEKMRQAMELPEDVDTYLDFAAWLSRLLPVGIVSHVASGAVNYFRTATPLGQRLEMLSRKSMKMRIFLSGGYITDVTPHASRRWHAMGHFDMIKPFVLREILE